MKAGNWQIKTKQHESGTHESGDHSHTQTLDAMLGELGLDPLLLVAKFCASNDWPALLCVFREPTVRHILRKWMIDVVRDVHFNEHPPLSWSNPELESLVIPLIRSARQATYAAALTSWIYLGYFRRLKGVSVLGVDVSPSADQTAALEAALAAIRRHDIEYVNLSSCAIDKYTAARLGRALALKPLRTLILDNANIGEEELASIAPALGKVCEISIASNPLRCIGPMAGRLPSVQSLNLTDTGLSPDVLRDLLSAIPLCSWLDLSANVSLGDKGACVVAEALPLGVSVLRMDTCGIGRAGASALGENLNDLRLHTMALAHNRVGASAHVLVSSMASSRTCHLLDLGYNGLGEVVLQALRATHEPLRLVTDRSAAQLAYRGIGRMSEEVKTVLADGNHRLWS
jgi:hypothetical protein